MANTECKQKTRRKIKEEKKRKQMNVFRRKIEKVILNSNEFSDEDDREIHFNIWQKGWEELSEDRQQELLDAKVTGSCVNDFVAWLKKSDGELPESYRSHGPQERLKIIFLSIEQDI